MKIVQMENWERREHFEFYSKCSTPHYCIAFNIEVSKLLAFTRANHISFYYSLIYLCTKAMNSVDEFLLEIQEGVLMKADRRIACFTDLRKGETVFHMVTLPCEGDIVEFAQKARIESENNPQPVYALEGSGEPQIIFSCVPWVDMTVCTNERDYNDPNLKDDTTPILVWGKYTEQDGKYKINMTLDVNHRLIDGYYVGEFVKKLEELIDELN